MWFYKADFSTSDCPSVKAGSVWGLGELPQLPGDISWGPPGLDQWELGFLRDWSLGFTIFVRAQTVGPGRGLGVECVCVCLSLVNGLGSVMCAFGKLG